MGDHFRESHPGTDGGANPLGIRILYRSKDHPDRKISGVPFDSEGTPSAECKYFFVAYPLKYLVAIFIFFYIYIYIFAQLCFSIALHFCPITSHSRFTTFYQFTYM